MENKPKSKVFFRSLDGIRGMAAILIVLRHTHPYFGSVNVQETYLGVDLFFLLSGIVIANAYEPRMLGGMPFKQFLKIRMVRIYPLYFLGIAIALLNVAFGFDREFVHHNFSLIAFFAFTMLPLPMRGLHPYPLDSPAWSLFLELVVNFMYAFLLKSLTRTNLLIAMAASAVVMACGGYFEAHHTLNYGYWFTSLPYAFFRVTYSFFAGVLLYRAYSSRALKPAFPPALATALSWTLLAVVIGLLMAWPPASINFAYDLLTVCVLFPAAVYASLWVQPSGVSAKIFGFLGGVSYAVYAIHLPLSIFVQSVLAKLGIVVENYAPLSGYLYLAFVLALCWLLDRIYDSPVRRLLMSLGATVTHPKTAVASGKIGASA